MKKQPEDFGFVPSTYPVQSLGWWDDQTAAVKDGRLTAQQYQDAQAGYSRYLTLELAFSKLVEDLLTCHALPLSATEVDRLHEKLGVA